MNIFFIPVMREENPLLTRYSMRYRQVVIIRNPSESFYAGNFASFSNEFDFDPLRGPVKDFSQTLMSENLLEVAKQVTGTPQKAVLIRLSYTIWRIIRAGACAMPPLPGCSDAGKVQLQGKCQLAALPSAGVTRETDDNGFVVSATGKEMKVEYRYDSEGYPLGKTTKPRRIRLRDGKNLRRPAKRKS